MADSVTELTRKSSTPPNSASSWFGVALAIDLREVHRQSVVRVILIQPSHTKSLAANSGVIVALISLLSCCGCSDGRLKTYPAKGKVVFKSGNPVHVGTVEIKSREHGVQARGSIDPDGNFLLTTYTDGDGAVAGMHDCVVVQFVMTEELKDFKPSVVGVVHPKYASYSTSGLTVEIKPDQDNDLRIELDGVKKVSPKDEANHDESQHKK